MKFRTKSVANGLELFRMTLYVFFPVAVFYVFNFPELFDRRVEDKRKTIFPEGNRPPLTLEENQQLSEKILAERLQRKESQQSTHS
eukprot:Em0011g40a